MSKILKKWDFSDQHQKSKMLDNLDKTYFD